MLLTRWSYTKEEWKRFQRWNTKRKGLFFFLFQWLLPAGRRPVPVVRIMADRVWVNDVHEPFRNGYRQFRDIHIREAGNINILEISYEQGNRIRGIKVPIPRGKLREAFEVQERLVLDNASIG